MADLSPTHARTLWRALLRDADIDLSHRRDFLPPLRQWVADNLGVGGAYFIDSPSVAADIASSDGLTRKFLLRLDDGQTIETVVMSYRDRFTACLSTQA